MKIAKYFKNEKGKWVIFQPPNVLLSLWLIIQVLNFALFGMMQPILTTFATMVLFAWAYNELRQGESPFRKSLGGIIVLVIIINLFMRWQ